MKGFLPISFLLVLAFSINTASAKIWRVNNNVGGFNADFTTLQAAHNGAASGDTVYLEGSPDSYGSLNCSKKLILLGPGYFYAENNIASISTHTAKVSSISMSTGAQGSEVMGLDFAGNALYLYTSNIIVKRNKFSSSNGTSNIGQIIYNTGQVYLNDAGANNIYIIQNYGLQIHGPSYANTGILINNNLIATYGYSGETVTAQSINLHSNTTALIQNNIFLRGTVSANNSSFTNNIMVNGFFDKRENMTTNNLANGAQFGTENGNQANVDMVNVFVNSTSPDERFKLKTGSPAIGAGYGSTPEKPVDAGMYYGNTAYKSSGLPGIPVIYFINVQSVGSDTDPIDVSVKVKSTN